MLCVCMGKCVYAARIVQRVRICGTLRLQHRQFDLSLNSVTISKFRQGRWD